MVDTYFVIPDEDNSICHFKIKEIPGFLFGIWNVCRFDTIKYQIENAGIGPTDSQPFHSFHRGSILY